LKDSTLNNVSQLTEHFPYIGFFLLLILGIGFPFPEDATIMLCGFLIAQEVIRSRKRIYGAAGRRHDSLSARQ
jgi:hypothetical protein